MRRTLTEGGRVIFNQISLPAGVHTLTAALLNGAVERASAVNEVTVTTLAATSSQQTSFSPLHPAPVPVHIPIPIPGDPTAIPILGDTTAVPVIIPKSSSSSSSSCPRGFAAGIEREG